MVKAMLRFKAFWSAAIIIAGIEIMHMIRKGQLRSLGKLWPAQQFYSLTAQAYSAFPARFSQLKIGDRTFIVERTFP
jgi:hypothetical protein